MILLSAFFGIPISLVVTLIVGLPLWSAAEYLGFSRRRDGLLWGALAGLCIAVLSTLLTLLTASPGSSWGDGGGWLVENGHMTARGWRNEAIQAVKWVLIATLAGPVAVWAARRGLGKAHEN